MRVGSIIAIIGVVLLLFGWTQPVMLTETITDCGGYWGACDTYTETTPNGTRTVLLALGNFLLASGTGAWFGTLDAENRLKNSE